MGSPKFGASKSKRAIMIAASRTRRRSPEAVDRQAVIASAKRIIVVANTIMNPTRRHDLVVEAAAIITLCGGRHAD